MIALEEYRQNFQPHDVPDVLVKLLAFFNEQSGLISDGFELASDDKGGIKTWSDNPDFLGCLYPIAQANASGSTYAIWRRAGALSDAPIVVFGDEGGIHVVAANIAGLLRILTLDAEPMIDDRSIVYFKGKGHNASEGASAYAEWLWEHFKLDSVTGMAEVEAIVKDAQKLHAEEFSAWLQKFIS